MTDTIPVVGLDPSLRNWGIAKALFAPGSPQPIQLQTVDVIQPVLPKGKQVRQNSIDLEAAKQLASGVLQAVEGAKAVFIEVPVGSQSARAMASYGICVGILGALRASGIPFFEVTPTEVKLAGAGSKNAAKHEMIQWAVNTYPEVDWPVHSKMGAKKISETKAEHMADAVAAIHAGIQSNPFQQLLPFLRN